MARLKEVRINVRTTEEIKQALEVTAGLRGLTVSSLVNTLAVKAIREERLIAPEAFVNLGTVSQSKLHNGKGGKKAASWREAFQNAKGIWKERNDLPDLKQLRREADRIDRRGSDE